MEKLWIKLFSIDWVTTTQKQTSKQTNNAETRFFLSLSILLSLSIDWKGGKNKTCELRNSNFKKDKKNFANVYVVVQKKC